MLKSRERQLRWDLGRSFLPTHLSREHGLGSHAGDILRGANLGTEGANVPHSSLPDENTWSKKSKILTQKVATASWKALLLSTALKFL